MTVPPAVADWGGKDGPFQHGTGAAVRHEPGRSVTHDGLWDYAENHLGFYGWLRVVNRRVERLTTVSLLDLPDRRWRDEYDGRVPPEEAADVAIDEAVAAFGIEPP